MVKPKYVVCFVYKDTGTEKGSYFDNYDVALGHYNSLTLDTNISNLRITYLGKVIMRHLMTKVISIPKVEDTAETF